MNTALFYFKNFVFAFFATAGYSIFFNVPTKLIAWVSTVGGMGWMIYLIGSDYLPSPSVYSFTAAVFVSILAEILARKLKQPAIIIVIPGILPLIPGIGLYRTVYAIMQKDYTQAGSYGLKALSVSIGIAMGILIISSLSKFFNMYQLKRAFINNDALKYVNWVNIGKNRSFNKYMIDKKEMNDSINSMNLDLSNEEPNTSKIVKSQFEDITYIVGKSCPLDSVKKENIDIKVKEPVKKCIYLKNNSEE